MLPYILYWGGCMVKKYKISYEIEIKEKMISERDNIIKNAGRFWEHAIPDVLFSYELSVGDTRKAKAIGKFMKFLIKKGKKIHKIGQKVVNG